MTRENSHPKTESEILELVEYPGGATTGSKELNLQNYEKALHLNREELRGKTILDLGSGRLELFSRQLKTTGIDVTVISLNPELKDDRHRDAVTRIPDWVKKSVSGMAHGLPFRDAVFDRVFAVKSITYYTRTSEAAEQAIKEIVRILKPGGEAILCPLYTGQSDTTFPFGHHYEKAIEWGSQEGATVQVIEEDRPKGKYEGWGRVVIKKEKKDK